MGFGAVRPPDGLGQASLKPGVRAKSSAREEEGSNGTSEVFKTEQEARKRMADAHQAVADAERVAESQIDEQREAYRTRSENEAAAGDAALDAVRVRGYEQLRELKRQQQAELNRVRHEGDREVARLKNFYGSEIAQVENSGKKSLARSRGENAAATELEEQRGRQTLESMKFIQDKRVADLKANQDDQVAGISAASHEILNRYRENAELARQKSFEVTEEQVARSFQDQASTVGAVENRAAQALRNIQEGHSTKLEAYDRRAGDPFYRMTDPGATLADRGDHFLVTAQVPSHEQRQISISAQDGLVTLSGFRRNKEAAPTPDGGKATTASFQSYTRSFPIAWPIDPKGVRREYSDGTLSFVIPKKQMNVAYQDYRRTATMDGQPVERLRPSRPDYPENLPLDGKTKPSS